MYTDAYIQISSVLNRKLVFYQVPSVQMSYRTSD